MVVGLCLCLSVCPFSPTSRNKTAKKRYVRLCRYTSLILKLAIFVKVLRTIMGVTKYQQWKERISSMRLAAAFGMEETILHLLMKQRLFGHLARMEPSRMPKQLLFGELGKKRPSHGTKRRWRDVAAADIKAVGVNDGWYDLAQDRQAWRALCQDGLSSLVEQHHSGWLYIL